MSKLHAGVILQVVEPGLLAHRMLREEDRKHSIEVGDIIEITIAYEWHFRTLDGEYFVAPEIEILKYCIPFAEVDRAFTPQRVSLESIMRNRLYSRYGMAAHSGYGAMPDYEAYKKISLAAFDKQVAKERKFIVKGLER